MATVELEGFDQYGVGPGSASTLPQGGWVVSGGGTLSTEVSIVPPLGFAGSALQIAPAIGSGSCAVFVTKNLGQNLTRIIGGVRLSVDYPNGDGLLGFELLDGATPQCSIFVRPLTGFVSISQGNDGTLLQQSVALIQDTSSHYIEFDITFGTGVAGIWTVWVDSILRLNGVGITQQSANAYCNAFEFIGFIPNPAIAVSGIFDDLYIFSNSGTNNNQVVLTNPFVFTQWPDGEAQAQFVNNGTFAANWQTVGLNPPVGDAQSVGGQAPNEDLYSFPVLPADILNVYAIGVSGNCRYITPDHTVDLIEVSNTVSTAGSAPGQTPAATYAWLNTYIDADPNTTSAWTTAGTNRALSGMKVAT